VARALRISTRRWRGLEREAFENWALVLDLIPDLAGWPPQEKESVVAILRAKAGRDEARYLRLLRRHGRLRAALLHLGSRGPGYNI
jgi:hypothetical protein